MSHIESRVGFDGNMATETVYSACSACGGSGGFQEQEQVSEPCNSCTGGFNIVP